MSFFLKKSVRIYFLLGIIIGLFLALLFFNPKGFFKNLSASVFHSVQNISSEDTTGPLYFRDNLWISDIKIKIEPNGVAATTIAKMEYERPVVIYSILDNAFQIKIEPGTTVVSQRSSNLQGQTHTQLLPWEGKVEPPNYFQTKNENHTIASFFGKNLQLINSFHLGKANEKFIFSSPVKISVPTNEPPNAKLFLIKDLGSGESYSYAKFIENAKACDPSLVSRCEASFDQLGKFYLVREVYTHCPSRNIYHGKYFSPPNCQIICDPGYELNTSGNNCKPRDFGLIRTNLNIPPRAQSLSRTVISRSSVPRSKNYYNQERARYYQEFSNQQARRKSLRERVSAQLMQAKKVQEFRRVSTLEEITAQKEAEAKAAAEAAVQFGQNRGRR